MPVQDACAELQRGLVRLKRIAASNAKDAIFLSQVGCSRSQWHAAWGVSGSLLHHSHLGRAPPISNQHLCDDGVYGREGMPECHKDLQ